MKTLRPTGAAAERRGAALMLALLVLFVLVAVVFQIRIGTDTDARVTRNTLALHRMDNAIEAALLQIIEDLKADAESDAEAGGGAAGGAGAGGGGLGGLADGLSGLMDQAGGLAGGGGAGAGGAPGGAGGGDSGPTDSRRDVWANPQQTEINRVRLRVLVQDEDSKYNVLCMLTEDEDEAEKAYERVVRILDNARGDTEADIDPGKARRMADEMLQHMREWRNATLPRPGMATDTQDDEDRVRLPLSLREFLVLPSFEEHHFRDFRDLKGNVVHSIGSFLTVWTSVSSLSDAGTAGAGGGGAAGGGEQPPGQGGGEQPPGQGGEDQGPGQSGGPQGLRSASGGNLNPGGGGGGGGGGAAGGGAPAAGAASQVAVNVNTAPFAVLVGLFDTRDVSIELWKDVLLYRNKEDEEARERREDSGEDPQLDERGQPIVETQIFENLDTLKEMYGWENLEPVQQAEVKNLLKVTSSVFSVYVTASIPTGEEAAGDALGAFGRDSEDPDASALTRTVRCVFWRRDGADGPELIPLQRWEVVDYMPYEVLDHDDEDR